MTNFFIRLFFSTVVVALVGLFPFLSWGSDYWFELICSFSISVANAIVGYYLVIISINKPNPEFYKLVYGGMLARVAVVFGFSIFMISQNHVAMVPFMLFLMLFYTMHQWIEISGWLKELPARKVQLNT